MMEYRGFYLGVSQGAGIVVQKKHGRFYVVICKDYPSDRPTWSILENLREEVDYYIHDNL